jgi:hypothetical protein
VDDGLGCVGFAFVVLAQGPQAGQPAEGSFHNSAAAQAVVQLEPEAAEDSIATIGVKDRPGGILGRVAPLTARAYDVKDAIEDLAIGVDRGRGGLELMANEIQLFIGQVSCIATRVIHPPIAPT